MVFKCSFDTRGSFTNRYTWDLDMDKRQQPLFYVGCKYIFMMTSSNGNIFRVAGPLCGEFTGHRWIPSQRPVTRSFNVFFDLRLKKRLSKQSRRRWFETPSSSLWRHCNVGCKYHFYIHATQWIPGCATSIFTDDNREYKLSANLSAEE